MKGKPFNIITMVRSRKKLLNMEKETLYILKVNYHSRIEEHVESYVHTGTGGQTTQRKYYKQKWLKALNIKKKQKILYNTFWNVH